MSATAVDLHVGNLNQRFIRMNVINAQGSCHLHAKKSIAGESPGNRSSTIGTPSRAGSSVPRHYYPVARKGPESTMPADVPEAHWPYTVSLVRLARVLLARLETIAKQCSRTKPCGSLHGV